MDRGVNVEEIKIGDDRDLDNSSLKFKILLFEDIHSQLKAKLSAISFPMKIIANESYDDFQIEFVSMPPPLKQFKLKIGDKIIYPSEPSQLQNCSPDKVHVKISLDQKQLKDLFKAIKRFHKEKNIIIYFNGPNPEKIIDIIKKLQVKDRILCAIWINPNHWENLQIYKEKRDSEDLRKIIEKQKKTIESLLEEKRNLEKRIN